MEILKYMFDERNPNNLIKSRQNCANYCIGTWGIIGILISVTGFLITLHYAGTYLLFGFIIAGSPDYNRITGCPPNIENCIGRRKLLCYQEDMSSCHMLGLLTLVGTILGLLITIILIFGILILLHQICIFIFNAVNSIILSYNMALDMTKNNGNNYDIAHNDVESPKNNDIILENIVSSSNLTEFNAIDIESQKEENIPLD